MKYVPTSNRDLTTDEAIRRFVVIGMAVVFGCLGMWLISKWLDWPTVSPLHHQLQMHRVNPQVIAKLRTTPLLPEVQIANVLLRLIVVMLAGYLAAAMAGGRPLQPGLYTGMPILVVQLVIYIILVYTNKIVLTPVTCPFIIGELVWIPAAAYMGAYLWCDQRAAHTWRRRMMHPEQPLQLLPEEGLPPLPQPPKSLPTSFEQNPPVNVELVPAELVTPGQRPQASSKLLVNVFKGLAIAGIAMVTCCGGAIGLIAWQQHVIKDTLLVIAIDDYLTYCDARPVVIQECRKRALPIVKCWRNPKLSVGDKQQLTSMLKTLSKAKERRLKGRPIGETELIPMLIKVETLLKRYGQFDDPLPDSIRPHRRNRLPPSPGPSVPSDVPPNPFKVL